MTDKIIENVASAAMESNPAKAKIKMIIIISAIVVVALVALFIIGKKTGLLVFETKIEKTANVVSQIRSTAEFTSVCFYNEFVVNCVKENKRSNGKVNQIVREKLNSHIASRDRVVLICKGKVRAGFDLKQITENDVRIHKDTLFVTLPKAQYFDVSINPSDFEDFERTGKWSYSQDSRVKQMAEEKLMEEANQLGILEKAESIGLTRLESMYKNFGFKVVKLTIRNDAAPAAKAETPAA